MKTEKQYYVYTYRHPDTNIPVYVGKGCDNRAYKHLKSSHNRKLSLFCTSLLYEGRLPCIDISIQVSEQAALDEEVRLIALYGRLDKKRGTLYNKTDGGYDMPKVKRGTKYRKNLSLAMKGNSNAKGGTQCGTLTNHTEESKRKISESQKARWAKLKDNK